MCCRLPRHKRRSPLADRANDIADLRAVVAIPLASMGALYLDQPIRQGIISRESIDRVQEFALRLIVEERTDLEESELKALYSASSAET